MADIEALARSAHRRLLASDPPYLPRAVTDAIRGIGISDKNDLRRLQRAVTAKYHQLGLKRSLRSQS